MVVVQQEFHPDLARAARVLPRGLVGPRSLRVVRFVQSAMSRLQRSPGIEVRALPSGGSVRIIRPDDAVADAPVLVWMHGGGYVLGQAKQDDALCRRFARVLGAVVVSVDYRLAPDHPYPAALDDCTDAVEMARRLDGVDPDRLAIGGASAGGGLAAQLAVRIRDRQEAPPVLQLLVYPMLDDRTGLDGPAALERGFRMWNSRSNRFGWSGYLGEADPLQVSPARQTDLSGLADAWIGVGDLDLFHDEDLAYADRLRTAGVPCAVEVIPGAFHGFDLVDPGAPVSREFFRSQAAALRAAFG